MIPVEAGCLALVVKDRKVESNIGKSVKVVARIFKGSSIRLKCNGRTFEAVTYEDGWLIQGQIKNRLEVSDEETLGPVVFEIKTKHGVGNSIVHESKLLRIDGYTPFLLNNKEDTNEQD